MITISPWLIVGIVFFIFVVPLLLFFVIFLWVKRRDIAAFFHPEDWFIGIIMRDDGTEFDFLDKYPPSYKYIRGGRLHFLTHRRYKKEWDNDRQTGTTYEARDGLLPPKTKSIVEYGSPHKIGRLTCYHWQEGDPWPRDMRTGTALVDPELLNRMEALKLTEMYDQPSPMSGIGMVVIIVLLLLVVAAVGYMIFKKPPTADVVQNVTSVAKQVIVR